MKAIVDKTGEIQKLIDKKGKLLIRGFETRRQDWCELAKKVQMKVLEHILNDKKDLAVKYVRQTAKKIKSRKVKISELTINVRLSKPLDKYRAVGPHVSVARKMKERGIEIKEGMNIPFVITFGTGSISQRAVPDKDATLKNYDPDYYIDNQIIPSALRVLSVFNVNEDDLK